MFGVGSIGPDSAQVAEYVNSQLVQPAAAPELPSAQVSAEFEQFLNTWIRIGRPGALSVILGSYAQVAPVWNVIWYQSESPLGLRLPLAFTVLLIGRLPSRAAEPQVFDTESAWHSQPFAWLPSWLCQPEEQLVI